MKLFDRIGIGAMLLGIDMHLSNPKGGVGAFIIIFGYGVLILHSFIYEE